eukprot:Plantae.Rhodophyta-Hildenbrandia_rubra.ctg11076.p1 GENE.Plantae.Rhodophyta-Hildenbrandia_rubra.ctg11076~~Plantae.Rhodophyta-Hildenbrandia_rubra.ctg11076.p1  ORF type:complete len:446 (+),score=61.16 Plantae.Rhodophyta-Hildenbrandia_rubra.ctg11076:27-1340(+)
MAFPYLQFAVASQLLSSIFDLYLNSRQRRCYKTTSPHPELSNVIPRDKFTKAQQYGLAKISFGMLESTIMTTIQLIAKINFFYARIWNLTPQILDFIFPGKFSKDSELARSLAFLAVNFAIDLILGLPSSIYKTFFIEAKYGFNRSTVARFVKDLLLSIGLAVVLGTPIACFVWWVMDRFFGPYMWLYLFGATVILSLVGVLIVPTVIFPLFNKFTPLEDGPLRTSIEHLAAGLKFPLKKIYVIDGSTRSSHSNAFFFGFWSKFICLFDTLLEQNKGNDKRIVAVMCHELGHWNFSHSRKGIFMGLILQFFNMALFGLVAGNRDLFRSFGFHHGTPHLIGLMLFSELDGILDAVLGPLQKWNSRRWEYQADDFAKQKGYKKELAEGLVTMQLENLGCMNPDPLYSLIHYTHPTLVERLKALDVKPDAVEIQNKEKDL